MAAILENGGFAAFAVNLKKNTYKILEIRGTTYLNRKSKSMRSKMYTDPYG